MSLLRCALAILAAALNSAAAVKHSTWGREFGNTSRSSSEGQMRVHVGPAGDVLESVVATVGVDSGSSSRSSSVDSQATARVSPAGAIIDSAAPDPRAPHESLIGSARADSAAVGNNSSSRGGGASMLRREGSSVALFGGGAGLAKDDPGDGAESNDSDGSNSSSPSSGDGIDAPAPLNDSHAWDSSSPSSGGNSTDLAATLSDPFADDQGLDSAAIPVDSPLAPLQDKFGKQEPLPKDPAPVQIPFHDHVAELMRSNFPAFEKVLAHHEEQPVVFTESMFGALQRVTDAMFADQVLARHEVEHKILDGMAHHVSEKGVDAPPADDPLLWHTLEDVEGTLFERQGEIRHKVIEQFAEAIVQSASALSSTDASSHSDDLGSDLDNLPQEDIDGLHDGFQSKLDDALGPPSAGFKELMNHSPDWFAPSASDAYVPSFEHSLDGAERKNMDNVKGLWRTLNTLYQNLTEYDQETRRLVGHELAHAINYSLDDGKTVMFHALGQIAEMLHERDSHARDMVQQEIIDEVFGHHVPLPSEKFNVTEALHEIDLPLPETILPPPSNVTEESEAKGETEDEEKDEKEEHEKATEQDHHKHHNEEEEKETHADTSKEKAGEGTTTTTTVKKSGASRTWDTKLWQLRVCFVPMALMPLLGLS